MTKLEKAILDAQRKQAHAQGKVDDARQRVQDLRRELGAGCTHPLVQPLRAHDAPYTICAICRRGVKRPGAK